MDGSGSYGRRPNGVPPSGRPAGMLSAQDMRRGPSQGSQGSAGPLSPETTGSGGASGSMNRAERFEDEKKRIIESCFSKTDSNGSVQESYITHIRIEEDAAYPQTPPPLDSQGPNKKPRLIIVAVRNTGRVRVHKARENANGTFSIGKTWNLEDLSSIESFSSSVPSNEEELQRKENAGDVGFVVTITKPYYWKAGSAKEKEFFIASLIKIYRKYTQGKVPELLGFNSREREAMVGPGGQQGRPSPGAAPPAPSSDRSRSSDRNGAARRPGQSPQPSPFGQQRPSPGPMSRGRPIGGQDGRTPSSSSRGQSSEPPPRPGPSPGYPPGDPLRSPRARPSQESDLRSPPSRDRMRPMPGQPPSLPSTDRLTPQSSRSDLPQRAPTPETQVPGSFPGQKGPSPRKGKLYQMSSEELRPSTQSGLNGLGISAPVSDRWKSRDESPQPPRPGTAPNRMEESVPERRRPPMLGPQNGVQSERSARDLDATAGQMKSPGLPRAPPSRGTNAAGETKTPQMPGGFVPSPAGSEAIERDGLYPPASMGRTKSNEGAEKEPTPEPVQAPAPAAEPEPELEPEPERPGLGRMFKPKSQKDIASKLRTAANAYSAFKPRAGGAADRLRLNGIKTDNEPDGITGVVPAPSKVKSPLPEDMRKPETPQDELPAVKPLFSKKEGPPKATTAASQEKVPEVKVSSPTSPDRSQDVPEPLSKAVENAKREAEIEAARKKRRRSAQQAKYLSTLGIDPSLLDGRGLEFESILGDFGWGTTVFQSKKIEALEADVRREISRVEAGSWLGHLEQKDERVEAVEKMLERAIAECDELEGLLTLYGVELSSLNDDVAFIEAQGQGLQVQTANQKLLHAELKNLVETISVTSQQLRPLKGASIGTIEGLESIESALLLLYKALITIDPALRQTSGQTDNGALGFGDSELATMRALQEKKDTYLAESGMFLDRLKQFMDMTFGAALMNTKDALDRQQSGYNPTRLDVGVHDLARTSLWQYSPLMLFAKEVEISSWEALIKMYQSRARVIYQEELRANAQAWQRGARKLTGEEQELLFTHQEKEPEGLSSTARKLTVKRSQTLARSLRSASGEKGSPTDKAQSGRLWPFECFGSMLDEMTPIVFTEQNFITEFFHASSSENADYAEAMAQMPPPEQRRGTNLFQRKLFEADRAMARRVADVMDEMYATWPGDLQNVIEWAVKSDPLQGVGIMHALERTLLTLEETNQDFITRTLSKLHERLVGLFKRFVDEQVRAIEDTKVKIKKRKGVIAFIKTFPNFSAAVENMFPSPDSSTGLGSAAPEKLEIRAMIDDSYQKINKAMFESLRVIAKESPGAVHATSGVQGAAAAAAAGDYEDKEALNYHILLIENMNHYLEEVDERGVTVLAEWRLKAEEEMKEHLELYVDAVVRRPLGKVLDFIESTESLLNTLPAAALPSTISSRSSHARPVFRKLLASQDNKELRRGVEALRKRVDKHFGDADDPGISRNLVAKVTGACELRYAEIVERVDTIKNQVYDAPGGAGAGEGGLEWWSRAEVAGAFKR